MCSNKTSEGIYYNQPTLDEALDKLEEHWEGQRRSENLAMAAGHPPVSAIWHRDEERVGIRPIVMALLLAFRHGSNDKFSPQQIGNKLKAHDHGSGWAHFNTAEADAIRVALREAMPANPDQSPTPEEMEICFEALRTPGKKDFPRYGRGGLHKFVDPWSFTYFAVRARMHLDARPEHTPSPETRVKLARQAVFLYAALCKRRPTTTREVFDYLQEHWLQGFEYPPLEITPPEKPKPGDDAPRHSIPAKYLDYLAPDGELAEQRNSQVLIQKAGEVVDALSRPDQKRVVAIISGRPNVGKSGCVVEILRALNKSPERTIGLPHKLEDGTDSTLPTLLINVQEHYSRGILEQVLAFLMTLEDPGEVGGRPVRLQDRLAEIARDPAILSAADPVQAIEEKIRDLHGKHAALFILTNWEDFTWTTPRAQLRDQCSPALVPLLFDSNVRSRIVISTTYKLSERVQRYFPSHEVFEITKPGIDDVQRFFRPMSIPGCYTRAIEDAKRIGLKTVDGAELILLATIMELCQGDETTEAEACEAIRAMAEADKSRKRLHRPIKVLVEQLYKRDMFRILAAIAASDDGLLDRSLREDVLPNWRSDTGWQPKKDERQISESLQALSTVARGFLVSRTPPAPANTPHGTSALEKADDAGPWEMQQTLRKLLFETLDDRENDDWAPEYRRILREAAAQIAKIAYFRAQDLRMKIAPREPRRNWRNLLLDMQAYTALLASLDPTALSDAGALARQVGEEPLLFHSLDRIFSAEEQRHAGVALRFTVMILLRGTLDRDNQMTMYFDQDQQRLRAYALIFAKKGVPHFIAPDSSISAILPKDVPAHIHAVFSPLEILELLEGLALSAFHAQDDKTVGWAWRAATKVIRKYAKVSQEGERRRSAEQGKGKNEFSTPELATAAIRILCSACDSAIRRGAPDKAIRASGGIRKKNSREDAEGHEKTLEIVREHLGKFFPTIGHGVSHNREITIRRISRNKGHVIKSWLRLAAREAELVALTHPLERGLAAYEDLFAFEEEFARTTHAVDATALSGRPSRSALRLFLRGMNNPNFSVEQNRKFRNIAEGIINSEISRLSRFGSGERISALVDRSRIHYVEGHLDHALSDALAARRDCRAGPISHGLQMQALVQFVATAIAVAEQSEVLSSDVLKQHGFERISDMLELAEKDADAVCRMATTLSFKPSSAIARYLQCRAQMASFFCTYQGQRISPPLDFLTTISKSLDMAITTMKDCQDLSFQAEMITLQNQVQALREARLK